MRRERVGLNLALVLFVGSPAGSPRALSGWLRSCVHVRDSPSCARSLLILLCFCQETDGVRHDRGRLSLPCIRRVSSQRSSGNSANGFHSPIQTPNSRPPPVTILPAQVHPLHSTALFQVLAVPSNMKLNVRSCLRRQPSYGSAFVTLRGVSGFMIADLRFAIASRTCLAPTSAPHSFHAAYLILLFLLVFQLGRDGGCRTGGRVRTIKE